MFALAQHYQRTGRGADAGRLMADYPRFKTTAPPVDDPLLDAVRTLNKGPDNLLSEAVTLEARGQLAAAADLQLKALELDPKLTQAHVNLIALYGRLGDPAKAERHYREATAVNPNAHEAYYNFGVLCYQAKRRDEARAAFEKALAINPGYAEAHNNLGTLLEEEGKLAGAAEHFRRAIEAAALIPARPLSPGPHLRQSTPLSRGDRTIQSSRRRGGRRIQAGVSLCARGNAGARG